MAGRYDRINGAFCKVKKKYDRIGGAWTPVKKRYDKVNGAWEPSYVGDIKWTYNAVPSDDTYYYGNLAGSSTYARVENQSFSDPGLCTGIYTFVAPWVLHAGQRIDFYAQGSGKTGCTGYCKVYFNDDSTPIWEMQERLLMNGEHSDHYQAISDVTISKIRIDVATSPTFSETDVEYMSVLLTIHSDVGSFLLNSSGSSNQT